MYINTNHSIQLGKLCALIYGNISNIITAVITTIIIIISCVIIVVIVDSIIVIIIISIQVGKYQMLLYKIKY